MTRKSNLIVNLPNVMFGWDPFVSPILDGRSQPDVVDNVVRSGPADPIRKDHGALWGYVDAETDIIGANDSSEVLEFGRTRPEVVGSALITNMRFEDAEYIAPSIAYPFGRKTQRIGMDFRTAMIPGYTQFVEYCTENYYGRSTNGFLKYFDDLVFNYDSPFTPREALRSNMNGAADIASTKFDYNFYTTQYEGFLNELPEGYSSLYPHLYTMYFEKERGAGLPGTSDVAPYLPRVNNPAYDKDFIYNDFVTLNRSVRKVFIDTMRLDPTAIPGPMGRDEKAGERDKGKYFKEWTDAFRSYSNGSAADYVTAGLDIILYKYKNIFLTQGSVVETQDFNSYKELFPMFSEVSFPSTPRLPKKLLSYFPYADSPPADRRFGLHPNVLQNVWYHHGASDFAEYATTTPEPVFSYTIPFAEEHQFVNMNSEEGVRVLSRAVPSGQTRNLDTRRKVFSLNEYIASLLGGVKPKVLGDSDFYLLLRGLTEAEQVIDTETGLPTRLNNPESEDEDHVNSLAGFTSITEQLYNSVSSNTEALLRNYEQLIDGETAFNQGTFFYVKKYAYDYEQGRGALLQTYIIPDTQYDLMFKLVDTQLRYDKSYEYEITLNTAVVGTTTKIKHLYISNVPGETPPASLPGEAPSPTPSPYIRLYSPSGVSAEYLDSFDDTPVSPDGIPSAAGGTILDVRTTSPELSADTAPRSFDSVAPYYAEAVIQTEPRVMIVEVPYAKYRPSWNTEDGSFGAGTILDNPSLAPIVNIIPYRAVNNRLLMTLNGGVGSRVMDPVPLGTADEAYLSRLRRMNVDPADDSILFENDDPPIVYEVYRLDRPPRDYQDFVGNRLTTVRNSHPSTGFKKIAAAAFSDTVEPNRDYYYIFRSIDFHNHASQPTFVYKVRLVDNDGAVYPDIKMFPFPTALDYRASEKKLKRFLQINPQLAQTMFNEFETGIFRVDGLPGFRAGPEDSSPTTAPTGDAYVSLGFEDVRLWEKGFKFRLTSRQTGKKIDLNIRLKKTTDLRRPTVPAHALPAAGTPTEAAGPGSFVNPPPPPRPPAGSTPPGEVAGPATPPDLEPRPPIPPIDAIPGGAPGVPGPGPGPMITTGTNPALEPGVRSTRAPDTGLPPAINYAEGAWPYAGRRFQGALPTRGYDYGYRTEETNPNIPAAAVSPAQGTRVFRDYPPAPRPPAPPPGGEQSSVDDPKNRRRRDDY